MAHHESQTELLTSHNLAFLEEMYEEYKLHPENVPLKWKSYFEELDRASGSPSPRTQDSHPTTRVPSRSNGTSYLHQTAPEPAHRVETVSDDQFELDERIKDFAGNSQDFVPCVGVELESCEEERFSFLRSIPLFINLEDEDIRNITKIVREVEYVEGDIICRRGILGETLYIIMTGKMSVRKGKYTFATLTTGEVFGELSVLDRQPRSANVVAETPARVLEIMREDFLRLLEEYPSIMRSILQLLASRMRRDVAIQHRVSSLVRVFRERGHMLAAINPLGLSSETYKELTPKHYGLSKGDLDSLFTVEIGRESLTLTLKRILSKLHQIYCQSIGVQFTHIDDPYIQKWLRQHIEEIPSQPPLGRDAQLRVLRKLTQTEVFETFLHKKFLGAKRFSLEGAESLIPLIDMAIDIAGSYKVDEVVLGMAHRGRLNVLANIMNKPYSQMFREFEDLDPEHYMGGGDVKYHMGYSHDQVTSSGHKVHISLCFNPSHLEFISPVVLGRARAKQTSLGDYERRKVLPIVVHGDAAFAGQGVVQEAFNCSSLPGYWVGGTIHIIVNNQIGFTTPPEQSRTCHYATDVARMLQIPIFHVNGEDPVAVCRVIELAMKFRDTFQRDVVIDMYAYRKYGHNEGDEPEFTQPLLYKKIKEKPTVREVFTNNLLKIGSILQTEADSILENSRQELEEELKLARSPDFSLESYSSFEGKWTGFQGGFDSEVPIVPTNISNETLQNLGHHLNVVPEGFTPHRKIMRFQKQRVEMIEGSRSMNWGCAEALAFASLLSEGKSIRLTGQDCERGTFSHRHAVFHDIKDGSTYSPFDQFESQASFEIHNSPLSEIAILGFEYGFSLDTPNGLVIWEAQFGDFCNVAQVIIDQFISSSEDKWDRLSGLVMLLPHGFEGQGPEHSSARLERFLSLAAEDNMQIVNLSTPAQFFHCLRRQVLRPWRKPLIVMSPKSLLRHPKAVSNRSELVDGKFLRVIPDTFVAPDQKARRVILCSGKIFYDLQESIEKHEIKDIAVIRMEQFYPFPEVSLRKSLEPYSSDIPIFWVQEEPFNMGAWPYLCRQFGDKIQGHNGNFHSFNVISRPESASPATGSKASHIIEQQQLLAQALLLQD